MLKNEIQQVRKTVQDGNPSFWIPALCFLFKSESSILRRHRFQKIVQLLYILDVPFSRLKKSLSPVRIIFCIVKNYFPSHLPDLLHLSALRPRSPHSPAVHPADEKG